MKDPRFFVHSGAGTAWGLGGVDMLRVGKISSIDYKTMTASITYEDGDDEVTADFPFLSQEINAPNVRDFVFVLHLGNGQEHGLVLGRYWSEKNKPVEGFKGLFRKWL
jgi:hypothetical protein